MNKTVRSVFGIMASGIFLGCSCPMRKMPPEHSRAMLIEQRPERVAQRSEKLGLDNIYFSLNSSELTESSKSNLRDNAEWLRTNMMTDVRIDGHADERGSNSYNMRLGRNRAMVAASYLKSLGVDPRRITTVSYGEERPLDAGHNENAWAKNRRVEFKALGTDDMSSK